jgi:hypothetical protein
MPHSVSYHPPLRKSAGCSDFGFCPVQLPAAGGSYLLAGAHRAIHLGFAVSMQIASQFGGNLWMLLMFGVIQISFRWTICRLRKIAAAQGRQDGGYTVSGAWAPRTGGAGAGKVLCLGRRWSRPARRCCGRWMDRRMNTANGRIAVGWLVVWC